MLELGRALPGEKEKILNYPFDKAAVIC